MWGLAVPEVPTGATGSLTVSWLHHCWLLTGRWPHRGIGALALPWHCHGDLVVLLSSSLLSASTLPPPPPTLTNHPNALTRMTLLTIITSSIVSAGLCSSLGWLSTREVSTCRGDKRLADVVFFSVPTSSPLHHHHDPHFADKEFVMWLKWCSSQRESPHASALLCVCLHSPHGVGGNTGSGCCASWPMPSLEFKKRDLCHVCYLNTVMHAVGMRCWHTVNDTKSETFPAEVKETSWFCLLFFCSHL